MGIVCGKGINDMPYGWASANDRNYRVYNLWCGMIKRCYSEKVHERHPTYKNCTVCERWLYLSNFVEDIKLIDGYEYWLNNPNQRISLDKDIKSNGINKCYCLEQCQFVSHAENTKQMLKTRDNEQFTGENNPMYNKHHSEETRAKMKKNHYDCKGKNHPQATLIDRFTPDGVCVDTKYQFEYVAMGMGFTASGISSCCTGRFKTYKGYVFKYHKDK